MPQSLETSSKTDFKALEQEAYDAWIECCPSIIAIDTETEGLGFYDPPFCVTVAFEDIFGAVQGYYLEIGVADSLIWNMLDMSEWIFHNAKFDLQKLAMVGLLPEFDAYKLNDTEALSHLIDENRPKRLKSLARDILDEETDEEEVLKKTRKKYKLRKEDGYHLLPREVVIPYARKDAEFTYRLFSELRPQLSDDVEPLYRREMELTKVLLEVESRGLAVDIDYLEAAKKDLTESIVRATLQARQLTGMDDLNVRSPKQLIEAFSKRGIELQSSSKDILRRISDPLADAVQIIRTDSKLLGTYIEPILREQRDGVLHPSYRQFGTRTGRLSSGGAEE